MNVYFIKDENHGEFGFVENAAGVEHVTHESGGGGSSGSVDDVSNNCGKRRGEGIEQDTS